MLSFLQGLVFGLLISQTFANLELTIIHTNDIHARISQSSTTGDVINDCTPETEWDESTHSDWFHGCHGGAARRKTAIDQLRAEIPNTLLMDAGDQFQGTLWYSLYRGDATAWVTDEIGYDVLTLGNHEFDDGDAVLKSFIHKLDPNPMLCANIIVTEENETLYNQDLWQAHKIFEFDGYKVGVIGYTHPETVYLANPGKGVSFESPKIAVEREIGILKGLEVDIIVAVGHYGFELDKEMAETIDGIDVIIGGHTDTFCYNGDPSEASPYAYPKEAHQEYPVQVTGPSGKKVCIAQDYTFGTWLGKMDIVFDDNGQVVSCGGNPIFMDGSTIAQDPVILEWSIEMYQGILDSYTNKIGYSFTYGFGEKPTVREQEVSVANLYTDAMVIMMNRVNVEAINTDFKDTRIAFLNGGALRSSLPKGDITIGTITTITPWNNDVLTLKAVPAWEIINMIEWGISGVEHGEGRFPHFSGIRYEYDPNQPALERLVSAQIICPAGECDEGDVHFIDLLDPANKDVTWDIITVSYVANGGDGYGMLPQYVDGIGGLFTETDLMVEYVTHFSPVTPMIDGRIKVVSAANEETTASPDDSGNVGLFAGFALMLILLSFM